MNPSLYTNETASFPKHALKPLDAAIRILAQPCIFPHHPARYREGVPQANLTANSRHIVTSSAIYYAYYVTV
ncbi:hypothetical protein A0H81_04770 [Grifola frondosa]|uniref:Uncharacterized protein n=1 Tax=Grifola frondosa TaxID=5627 RepID=A0A1C7MG42_GRIFR|nr:hypothetical protein A0H81_04770 [Grifola frondosa]